MPIDPNKIKAQIEKAYTRRPVIPRDEVFKTDFYAPQRPETPEERARRERKQREFDQGYRPIKSESDE